MKFARQVAIDTFFADFVCREHKVIIEIDGATHGTPREITADLKRTLALEAMGYRIFRASNADVFDNLEGVLQTLLEFIETCRSGDDRASRRPSP